MQIATTRFGSLAVDVDDLLHFPRGLMGFEDCRHWVLLADSKNSAVGWLQSADRPAVALAVVSPRRFAPEYRIRINHTQLSSLDLADASRLYALCAVNRDDGRCTMNLRAPILINLDRRLGCQVVTADEQPLQLELTKPSAQLRKSA